MGPHDQRGDHGHGPGKIFDPDVGQLQHAARVVRRSRRDVVMATEEQKQDAEDANALEMAQVLAAACDHHHDDDDDADDADGSDRALDATGAFIEGAGRQRHAVMQGKRPSMYQIPIGGGKTMHIRTLLSLLSKWYVTNKGQKLSHDRLRRVAQADLLSKAQAGLVPLALDLVQNNGPPGLCGGSWVAVIFEAEQRGRYRCWLGMVQRITHRPAGKASLYVGTLPWDHHRIGEYWLNISWLTECHDDVGDHLEYKWLVPFSDFHEVSPLHVILVPDLTYDPDTMHYTLAADDLRRINQYLEDIADTDEAGHEDGDDAEPAAAAAKPKNKHTGGSSATDTGMTVRAIEGTEGKRTRYTRVSDT